MTPISGDILLWRVDPGAPLLDRLIGWGETKLKQVNSRTRNYYHCGFVSGSENLYFESKPPRICLSLVPNPLPVYVEVYRVIGGLTLDQRSRIFIYALSRVGRWYDFLGVLTGGFIEIGGLEFCSKYTANAFSYAPIQLCPSEMLMSPDDIAASPMLTRVG